MFFIVLKIPLYGFQGAESLAGILSTKQAIKLKIENHGLQLSYCLM